MDHPSGGCPPAPGELDKMTTEELLAALDALFGSMTEESYDGALLRAYLDALDRKAPIGAMPTAEESLAAFHSRLETMPARGRFASRPRGARRALRGVFAADSPAAGRAQVCRRIVPLLDYVHQERALRQFQQIQQIPVQQILPVAQPAANRPGQFKKLG